jgi:hypothetical protein
LAPYSLAIFPSRREFEITFQANLADLEPTLFAGVAVLSLTFGNSVSVRRWRAMNLNERKDILAI